MSGILIEVFSWMIICSATSITTTWKIQINKSFQEFGNDAKVKAYQWNDKTDVSRAKNWFLVAGKHHKLASILVCSILLHWYALKHESNMRNVRLTFIANDHKMMLLLCKTPIEIYLWLWWRVGNNLTWFRFLYTLKFASKSVKIWKIFNFVHFLAQNQFWLRHVFWFWS